MYYFVKVRIDVARMSEYGQKLRDGSITTHAISTHCLLHDPAVGLNIWEAKDEKNLEELLTPHRPFYSQVIEIAALISPLTAMQKLMTES